MKLPIIQVMPKRIIFVSWSLLTVVFSTLISIFTDQLSFLFLRLTTLLFLSSSYSRRYTSRFVILLDRSLLFHVLCVRFTSWWWWCRGFWRGLRLFLLYFRSSFSTISVFGMLRLLVLFIFIRNFVCIVKILDMIFLFLFRCCLELSLSGPRDHCFYWLGPLHLCTLLLLCLPC